MNKLVIKFHTNDESSWGCVADNCNFVRQGNAQLDQVLKHATTCRHLQVNHIEVWKDALDEEEKELSDDESDSESEDSEPHWDEILLPHAPTFEVDRDIDMTSQALQDMVSTEHSVGPSVHLQSTSSDVHEAPRTSSVQPDWDW